jgi:hypothetical protein
VGVCHASAHANTNRGYVCAIFGENTNLGAKMMITKICFLSLYVAILSACSPFPKEEKLLKTYTLENRLFEAYYVGLGATTNDVIQVKEVVDQQRKLIKAFEGYNHVLDLRLEDPKTLIIVLSDTSHFFNKPDTLRIDLD